MSVSCAEDWLRDAVVLQVAHVTETYGPVQALTDYLRRRCRRLGTVEHPFLNSRIPSSALTVYDRGREGVVCAEASKGRSEVRQYVRDLVLTLRFALKFGSRVDLYVGMNSLDTLPGLLLRAVGRVQAVLFYTVDYAERRFENAWLNRVYKFLDRFCVRHADAVFSNTRRVMAVRRALGLPDARNVRLPNGVHLRNIPPLRDGGPTRLIYVGRLTETHGLQTVLGAVLEEAAEFPELRVLVAGSGPYEENLRRQVAERSLTDRFSLLGAVPNREVLLLLSEGGIGLAPYTLDEDYVRYCDPVKVKEYLACGCPVLVSDVPEVAEEVARCDAGLVYRDARELRAQLRRLLSDRALYDRLRRNAIGMGRRYDWDRIFDGAFQECFHAIFTDWSRGRRPERGGCQLPLGRVKGGRRFDFLKDVRQIGNGVKSGRGDDKMTSFLIQWLFRIGTNSLFPRRCQDFLMRTSLVRLIYGKVSKIVFSKIGLREGNGVVVIPQTGILHNLNLKFYIEQDMITAIGLRNGNAFGKDIDIFGKLLKAGYNVIDIGANIGVYSVVASKIVGESGKVYSFEPVKLNYKMLLKNMDINDVKNIVPVEKAAGEKSGKLRLYLKEFSCTTPSITKVGDKFEDIDVVSLDEHFAHQDVNIDLVKVDVEGAELSVINGMKDLISKNKNMMIYVEFTPRLLEKCGKEPSVFLKQLSEVFGYMYLVNEKEDRIERINYNDRQSLDRLYDILEDTVFCNLILSSGQAVNL
ncbi:MAG: hypothetical protein A3F84_11675 [Candidatus Handelsmanbacteria bacterium RIFCSPLOWO2_12_FULL_64_10]|uniref:Methyltransferase FkbM domain-containing protein n=1 Tax=Handelsmanbacteria sp. (strain RIFCSPLOWO2_12_FULL_64_10) TaxID=1817868 RepID=A0A1F6CBG3_HANXR|nr:MAG: hypothetical protein A3F84_11675 [Candidatus Handelsmanbacteria bacterium RIFCSPLOWO2_12_FULL_64_10]